MKSDIQRRKDKGMSYLSRLFSKLGYVFMAFVTLCSTIILILVIVTPSRRTENFWDEIFPLILMTGIPIYSIIANAIADERLGKVV